MYPKSIANEPVFGGSYVPYFYQSGQFLAYGLPKEADLSESQWRTLSRYDFTSDLSATRSACCGADG